MQGYAVIEEELGGAGVWDIMVPAPKVLTAEYFAAVSQLQQELRNAKIATEDGEIGLTKVLSIVDAIEALESDAMAALIPQVVRLQLM